MMVRPSKETRILMKILTRTTLLVSLFAIGLGTTFASSTDELQITSGGFTATITDSTTLPLGSFTCTGTGCYSVANTTGIVGDSNGNAGTVTAGGDINGWVISVTSGTSNSPGLVPYGIDISSLTAACDASTCGALDIQYSDINFSTAVPVNGFQTTYSATFGTGTGSTSESAYFSNSNTLFAETTLIGTVGPFTTSNNGSATGGAIAAVPDYSLTLDQVFTGTQGVSFSVDGNITVPEPGAVVLFGTVLVFCATKLRRRLVS